ncbi:MAG: S-formylglutathione hydrolase [Alphaproteobacteria bacterium]|nr:S-formylglutathione hydrolase [Alphaproteobacteria bacterium]
MTDFQIVEHHQCFEGKQLFCQHHSTVLGCAMNFAVYLPPKAELLDCPVLWFLSGLTCTEGNFIVKSGVQRYAAEHSMIVVSPDTSPRGTATAGEDADYALGTGAGFYVDATQAPWSKHYRMYSYIIEELQQLIVSGFPVLAHQQAITGFSMGGHGALVLGLRHPGLFRSVSALAPICAPSQCPWGKNAYKAYFGSDVETWSVYDAVQLISQGARHSTIYVDQGSDDEFLGEQLRPELLQQVCNQNGQDLRLRMLDGYDHSFYFVSSVIGDHVALHAERLQQG